MWYWKIRDKNRTLYSLKYFSLAFSACENLRDFPIDNKYKEMARLINIPTNHEQYMNIGVQFHNNGKLYPALHKAFSEISYTLVDDFPTKEVTLRKYGLMPGAKL